MFALSCWSARILPWAAGWTPVPSMLTSRSPDCSRLSMSSALTLSCHAVRVGQRRAVGVGGLVPVGVALEREALAEVVRVEHVRARGDHVLLVLAAGVLGRGHRDGRGQLGEVVEARERRLEVEDDRLVVGRVDRLQAQLVRALVLVRAGVALQVQRVVEVRRAVRERRLVQRALDGVLDVLARDRRAVLELDARAQLVGPGLGVVAGHTEGLGEVGHERGAVLAGRGLEHHQRAAVEPHEVPRVGVVGVGRVERVPVAGVRHPDACHPSAWKGCALRSRRWCRRRCRCHCPPRRRRCLPHRPRAPAP